MPSDEHAFSTSSVNGVSASAISVVTIGTSSPFLRIAATSGGRSFATVAGSMWPLARTVISMPSKPSPAAVVASASPSHELQVLGEDRDLEFRARHQRDGSEAVRRRPTGHGARWKNL